MIKLSEIETNKRDFCTVQFDLNGIGIILIHSVNILSLSPALSWNSENNEHVKWIENNSYVNEMGKRSNWQCYDEYFTFFDESLIDNFCVCHSFSFICEWQTCSQPASQVICVYMCVCSYVKLAFISCKNTKHATISGFVRNCFWTIESAHQAINSAEEKKRSALELYRTIECKRDRHSEWLYIIHGQIKFNSNTWCVAFGVCANRSLFLYWYFQFI